jgi:hypothetical protein
VNNTAVDGIAIVLVNDKEMIPRKDYVDYSRYINEQQTSRR